VNKKADATIRAADARRGNAFPHRRTREVDPLFSPRSEYVFNLHKTIGNQAVQRLFESGIIRAKLKIGQPNDRYEQEADRVADQVMRMPEQTVQMKPG
jgi:hypothetical protein